MGVGGVCVGPMSSLGTYKDNLTILVTPEKRGGGYRKIKKNGWGYVSSENNGGG